MKLDGFFQFYKEKIALITCELEEKIEKINENDCEKDENNCELKISGKVDYCEDGKDNCKEKQKKTKTKKKEKKNRKWEDPGHFTGLETASVLGDLDELFDLGNGPASNEKIAKHKTSRQHITKGSDIPERMRQWAEESNIYNPGWYSKMPTHSS